jgi:hypothetical protein
MNESRRIFRFELTFEAPRLASCQSVPSCGTQRRECRLPQAPLLAGSRSGGRIMMHPSTADGRPKAFQPIVAAHHAVAYGRLHEGPEVAFPWAQRFLPGQLLLPMTKGLTYPRGAMIFMFVKPFCFRTSTPYEMEALSKTAGSGLLRVRSTLH